jgi:hypothetical protein
MVRTSSRVPFANRCRKFMEAHEFSAVACNVRARNGNERSEEVLKTKKGLHFVKL